MARVPDHLLQRYFDGTLSDHERADLEARFDDEDRAKLRALTDLRLAVRAGLDGEAAGVDLLPGIEAALARKVRKTKKLRSVPLLAALAASALLVALLRGGPPTSACDIESLEVEGAVASVFHAGDATVIFAEEE